MRLAAVDFKESCLKSHFEGHLFSPTQARSRIETKAAAMISSAFTIAVENCPSLITDMCPPPPADEFLLRTLYLFYETAATATNYRRYVQFLHTSERRALFDRASARRSEIRLLGRGTVAGSRSKVDGQLNRDLPGHS